MTARPTGRRLLGWRCSTAFRLAGLVALLLPGCGLAAELRGSSGAPLPVGNLSPVDQLLGMPRVHGELARSGGSTIRLGVAHANNFAAEAGDADLVLFDGSTTVTRVGLRRGLGDRWEWGIELPYVHHSGGITDGFIDEFHDLFGFPDGGRNEVPRDRLDYRLVADGRQHLAVTSSRGGLGDVGVQLGHALHRAPDRQVVLRARLELPTGDEDELTGSGSTDAAVWVELMDDRWLKKLGVSISLAGGLTVPMGSELIPQQRDVIATAHLGLHYPLSPRVTLRAQLDGHSETADSRLKPLDGGALLGTLGGSVQITPALWLDLGLVEDLTTDRAPDVVFLAALRVRL